MTVLVANPPDLSLVGTFNEMKALVGEFEAIEAAAGPETTALWLRQYSDVTFLPSPF